MQEKSNSSAESTTMNAPDDLDSINTVDYSDLLPLELIKSETVPPSPNRSESTIDWLPEFAGFSWIAYGASSLLVISHFPSPLSEKETLIGPIFRQVLELSGDESGIVKAVAWSPSTPSKGELAVALENCVCLYLESSETMQGSFCWSQIAVLVQSSKMESIKWTGCGDGIIAAGIEVVLWKKKGKTWEIAWKFRPEQPQTLVSATWSIEGPAATAAYSSRMQNEGSSSLFTEASRCVFVYHSDGKSGYVKAELHHPWPVSMIQWRPSTTAQLRKDIKQSQRDVLLTCCFDGTVRLWSEIDSGRARKFGKDTNDLKTMRKSFHVTAVIEINQSLHGTLGTDTFVTWAIENVGMINTSEEAKQHLSTEGLQQDAAGRCEWLIGFGPGTLVTFWAIHCLDDISPLRFPRVTLWKRQEMLGPDVGHLHRTDNSNSKHQSLLNKFIILRSQLFGPPTKCSLIQLLPCNSMRWSQLYTPTSSKREDGSCNKSREENFLSCSAGGVLSLDGHTGNILQVAVHPSSFEVEVAVSLDSKGLLLFWSLSTISRCLSDIPSLVHPTWKLLGKSATQDLSCFKYSCLRWAPSVLNGNWILLVGHDGGIDCFIIKISEIEEAKMLCHKLCTIPFTGHSHGDGPTNIFAMPLPSNCTKTLISNSFMLLGIWTKKFQALSWKVTVHFEDLSEGSCGCSFDTGSIANCSIWSCENTFSGIRYRVVADPCSSKLPDLYNPDQVTSVAVVCPGNLTPSLQKKWVSTDGLCSNPSAYHMATGCSDGSVKLWRSNHAKSSNPHSELAHLPWELVGLFSTHQGPVSAISLSSCGRKIATISTAGYSDTVSRPSTLHIWDSIHLIGAGTFLLEDNLLLDGVVVALNWLATGNGLLLLGVCMQNELRVFAQRRCGVQTPGKSMEMHIWFCIAFGHTSPAARDFLWGPRAMPVLVHDRYFCHFSQWSFYTDKKHQGKCYPEFSKDNPLPCMGGTDKDMLSAIFTDCNICNIKELSMGDKCEGCKCMLPAKMNMKNDNQLCNLFLTRAQWHYDTGTMIGLWSMLEVAEKLCGSLPVYHSETLLLNIYSGNWKRAYVAVRHLVGYLTFANASEKGYSSAKFSHIIPQIHLSNYFQVLSTGSGNKGLQWGGDAATVTSASQLERSLVQFVGYNSEANASDNMFSPTTGKSDISGFIETLEKFHDLAAISNMEKIKILAVIDLLGEISDSCSPYGSLDEPGRRFWVAVRFQRLYFLRRFGRLATMEELVVNSELFGWAFHSDCQENLFGSVLSNEPSWREMRNFGVGFWFTNATQLRTRMEKLARLQYLKKKDPKDCALLYIALNRLQVLAGLFKISKDEKDKPLVGFLSRNFQEDKNKAAALKNAYVLMGRHQLELAIAFFLLGGDPSSAITVCTKNLGDEQLALIICRLLEGYGGTLERHLISKLLLPAATEKGDYWLTSLLEWALGNYYQSYLDLLGLQVVSVINKSALSSNNAAFLNPDIGQYCLTLATKNSLRNAVGECGAAILARWATLMNATASNRRGISLEALECLSSSLSIIEGKDQDRVSDIGNLGILQGILHPSPHDGFNWLSGDVAFQLESHAKLDLAMQYISKVIMEHPSWPDTNLTPCGALICPKEYETHQYDLLLEKFKHKLNTGLTNFEQKYSLSSIYLINMIFVYLYSKGLLFLGYHILDSYTSPEHSQDQNHAIDSILLNPILPKLLLKTTEEISYLFARYIVACSITCSSLKPSSTESTVLGKNRSCQLDAWDLYVQCLIQSMRSLRPALKLFLGFPAEDLPMKAFISLDLFEYHVYIVSAWLQRNMNSFIMMIQPILVTYTDGHTPSEIDVANLKKLLYQSAEVMAHGSLSDDVGGGLSVAKKWKHEHGGDIISPIPEDERWQLIGACLWRHLSNFTNDQLKSVYEDVKDDYSSRIPPDPLSSMASSSYVSNGNSTLKQIKLVSVILIKLLQNTLAHISSYHAKQLALFLQQKVEKGLVVPTLVWLAECSRSQPRALHNYLNHEINSLQMINNENGASFSEILLEISADSKIVHEVLAEEKISCSQFISQEPLKGWTDAHKDIMVGSGTGDAFDQEGRLSNVSASSGAESPARGQSPEDHSFLGSRRKESTLAKEVTCFQNPKEVFHKNGELLEAMCINSIDQQQAAVASNRKGIIFFKWKDEAPFRDQSDYIWLAADWPHNGWAGSESTPIPTVVSPGVGLGSKKGAHLGLGGATIGVGSLARPGRDLTGGGAFGIPGYAGIGASGLGWGIQEDFEEFVDPPATVENVRTRALSSHPSRPLFLVGSSNTHVYLWEFGKDRATATYGVLPAANVPPPYALASISALQFDHCGHRFATAALDGTVCTWQLEVGGRSNVRPTESSLCFNSHTSDVSYVAASGSIIAAAGYSSNGVNVVIWDTLAPPTTSQASLTCHEGGARSLSVFDNDIGSGSISPLIVTGGKGGDVGLHDFRFIATGRTKRHRHSNTSEQSINFSSTHDTRSGISSKYGEQNLNGMLWYIPKAHLGSITRISTIPNTSLFLTGSKDGDIKLWDAKRAELVFHWPKLHERHTFLQPSSRGFGGVVRAAVTDIQVLSHGFLSSGGDGSVKLVQVKDFQQRT